MPDEEEPRRLRGQTTDVTILDDNQDYLFHLESPPGSSERVALRALEEAGEFEESPLLSAIETVRNSRLSNQTARELIFGAAQANLASYIGQRHTESSAVEVENAVHESIADHTVDAIRHIQRQIAEAEDQRVLAAIARPPLDLFHVEGVRPIYDRDPTPEVDGSNYAHRDARVQDLLKIIKAGVKRIQDNPTPEMADTVLAEVKQHVLGDRDIPPDALGVYQELKDLLHATAERAGLECPTLWEHLERA